MTDPEFVARYAMTPTLDIARLLGMSRSTVARRARALGARKSELHRSAVQRERMLGRHLSPETRERIASRARGRPVTPEATAAALRTKLERGTLLKGERHPNWKGGRPWTRFRQPEYLAWRRSVLERDSYRCRDCDRVCLRYETGLAAHHLLSYAGHPEVRYEVSNGVTLCRLCHMTRHGKRSPEVELLPCACGCGTLIRARDPYGRSRRFVNHHAARGRRMSEQTKAILRKRFAGRRLSTAHRAAISHGLRTTNRPVGRPAGSGEQRRHG